ncbi:MAG: branched-chain amino acid transaminase [Candidatus Aminicenantes bacterium]|nr:branched-chain amino acid transaminase [Candidatus Aminicenantes bacterium]
MRKTHKGDRMFDNKGFPKAKTYWFMGKFYDWSEAIIHPMTHALHYGNSVFEGIRAYKTPQGPAVFRLKEHLDRFMHSAGILKMKSPYSIPQITDIIKSVIRENKLESAYIRPLLFYSYGNLGLIPKSSPVELLVGAWQWGAYLGENALTGVKVYILPWRRVHHSQYDMSAKLGGIYVQSTICGLIAREQGCDEAVFLNLEKNVAEGPGENIFIYKDGFLKTNDRSESVLEGITRSSILEIAHDLGIQTKVEPITKQDFLTADEAFFSGTAAEIAPITRAKDASDKDTPAKDHTIGSGKPGEVTQKISTTYGDCVRGKIKKYEKWLTYVD